MSRWRAAGIHLGTSLIVAAIVASVIYFIWYPPPYFRVSGGSTLIVLIMGVDVMIGPCLTLAVFRTGKRGLAFDLAVILALQVAAFGYGLTVIVKARPVFIVASVDRFVPVYANDLDDKDLAQAKRPEFASLSWSGPRLVGALMPSDPSERTQLAVSAIAGKDVEKQPKYYVSYAEVRDSLIAKAKPLTVLADKVPANSAVIKEFIEAMHRPIDSYVYLPLLGRIDEYAMIVSLDTNMPVWALHLDPW